MTNYIGIDIGKEKINYAFCPGHILGTGDFKNTVEGINDFLSKIPQASHCVMEATGMYHFPLAYALEERGMAFTVLNPVVSKAYGQSLGSISKTDDRDAVMLQRLGAERQLVAMHLPEKAWQTFRHRINHWQNLQHDIQVLKNRLHALGFHPQPDELSLEMMQQQLQLFQEQLKIIEKQLQRDLPVQYAQQLKKATTIKGIGKKTALCLLFFTQGLESFASHKALAKYIGIAPNVYQSGSYQKKGRICRRGNALLRSLLYNCARSAKRCNHACKELYQKLRAKGKTHKVAMVAVMHKLIRQFFAVVKNNVDYLDNYQQINT